MMTSGEAAWFNSYPHLHPRTITEEFIGLLGEAWETNKCSILTSWDEDDITRALYDWMIRAIRTRKMNWNVSCQPEVTGLRMDGKGKVIGRCDLTVNVGWGACIFECKRIWPAQEAGTFTTAARLYVTLGLYRFLKPSEKHPTPRPQYQSWVGFAGMIGYVMNGNTSEAHISVNSAIVAHAQPHDIIDPHFPTCPTVGSRHFLSVHRDCQDQQVKVHHILLAVPHNNEPELIVIENTH